MTLTIQDRDGRTRPHRAHGPRPGGVEGSRVMPKREAHRLYTEMGATGHAERLARELAALS